MQTATADVVVFDQAENLRFVGIAIVSGYVQDLVYITPKRRPSNGAVIVRVLFASRDVFIFERERTHDVLFAVLRNLTFDTGLKFEIRD